MNTKIIKTLVKKEILDVFRDKKTVIMMLVVPVLLYPLIFIGAMAISSMISSNMEKQTYRIAVEAEDNGAFLQKLEQANEESQDSDEESTYELVLVDADSIGDYEEALNAEEIDVYISGQMQDGKMQYDAYYLSSITNSSYAESIVMDLFEEYREDLTEEKIVEAGLDVHEILEPVSYVGEDIASSEQSLGNIMGSILPFMLIVSLLMGTMYPAIDTTAGERERGTLETILTLPVTNRQLIVSKFLTVALIGIISALLNILSMGGIAVYMYQIMDLQTETQAFDVMQFVPAILVCILAIFAFSLFISAITMCVTAFAKSYKEANNYITPLMLVVMFVGYIGFIPNIEFNHTMAMMPVANICLLIKNMLVFKIDYTLIAVVLISNVAYALFAILFLSKIYDSEAVLFGDGKASMQLFEKRSNLKKGGVPSMSDVWFVLALTTMLFLYGGSILQVKYGLWGVFASQMILLGVPLLVVWYTKKDMKQTYGLQKTKAAGFVGGFIQIIGMFCINLVVSTIMIKLFPNSASNITNTFSELMDGNLVESLFVIALTPAICEELLFRGVMFQSMKKKYRISTAIILVGVLFGAYHMSMVKFIPTGLLGVVLCYTVYVTGSIYPAMMMHFVNNALSVIISYFPEQIGEVFPVFYQEMGVSDCLIMLGIGLILFGIGQIILRRSYDSNK
ncbi:MAG: CPBP family intramembrane metalloprotease [Lachnospiraceae bacterium]|nr:CPBP family intramembrane metalloprotease [Lachnospiraceae bacterium]